MNFLSHDNRYAVLFSICVYIFCQNVAFCFCCGGIFAIFVAHCVAEPFWHTFGYNNNVRTFTAAPELIKRTLKTDNYEH